MAAAPAVAPRSSTQRPRPIRCPAHRHLRRRPGAIVDLARAVLMRCGPAYGLDGEWSAGEAVSRVLIDALPGASGFTVSGSAPGLLSLELSRELHGGHTISQRQTALAAGAAGAALESQAR